MIIDLNGVSQNDARAAAQRFLEHTNSAPSLLSPTPRKTQISDRAAKLERERMRAKVAGTKKMRSAILALLDEWRGAIVDAVKSAKVREADTAALASDLSAAVASGVLTVDQAEVMIQELDAALAAMDPKKLAAVILQIQQELFQAGLDSGIAELGITWDVPPTSALEALAQQVIPFSQDVVDREMAALKQALADGIAAGDSIPQLSGRIADTFDDGMHILDDNGNIARVIPNDSWAEMVARTETSRAMNAGVFRAYHAAGVEKIQWIAAEDERTCFPAGTLVATSSGERSIETIAVGDLVRTPVGLKRVSDTLSRPYSGTWVWLDLKERQLLCTATHPIWVNAGWLEAIKIKPGDLLQAASDQAVQVERAIHFQLAKSDDSPSASAEERFLCTVLSLNISETMPICTVDLDRNQVFGQSEVDAIPADSEFLMEGYAEIFERFTHAAFQPVLAGVSSVATEAAEHPVGARASSEGFTTREALVEDGRTSTQFGAVASPGTGSSVEDLRASFAFDVGRVGETTLSRADRPAIRAGRWNGEDLPTNWAKFIDPLSLERPSERLATHPFESAGPATKLGFAGQVGYGELLAALGADATGGHATILAEIASGRPIPVFNLEVDKAHVFYAENTLVHNCPQCSDLDGTTTIMGTPFEGGVDNAPAHVSCRCTTVSVGFVDDTGDSDEEQAA